MEKSTPTISNLSEEEKKKLRQQRFISENIGTTADSIKVC